MKTIALSAVTVSPNRQRRQFDAVKLQEFKSGIEKRGLLHPIVLRVEGEGYVLVAGERRLRVISDLADLDTQIRHDGQLVPLGFIPYTLLEDLDELAAEEAELEENTHRSDLTWQEQASAHARLKTLRDKQAAGRGDSPPTVAELAVEIRGSGEGVHQATVRRELIVARHLNDPEVAGAKSADEAWKILKKKDEAKKNQELGAAVGRTFTADVHRAIHGDSLEWMAACPAEQYDVILTDPPYGMGADEFGDSGGLAAGAHGYEDSNENATRCYEVLATEGFRVAKAQAHLYAFCDQDMFPFLKVVFHQAGWQVVRTMLIWHKPSAMRAPWPEHGPQRKYETLLYAVKGKRPVTKMAPDLFAFPPDSNLGHAAQKPVALFQHLLERSVRPGDSILDPFMGSGPIFPAAHALKCRATGIEMSQTSYGIAVKRIEELKVQLELGL